VNPSILVQGGWRSWVEPFSSVSQSIPCCKDRVSSLRLGALGQGMLARASRNQFGCFLAEKPVLGER
jgi:hypothetical protein